jgi:adenylate kinase
VIVLLFGPPGCGKGTQAGGIASRFKIPAISTGEVFRAEIKAGTPLGKTASAILAAGGLVGDDIVNGIVANRIAQPDCAGGFLLDGYPRTVPQAQFLSGLFKERGLPDPVVMFLDVPDLALVARLTSRRQCPKCGRIYNILYQPPAFGMTCDDCHTELVQRADDQEAVIKDRLQAYRDLTGPILDFYGPSLVRRVDGRQAPESVAKDIAAILDKTAVPASA